MNRLEQVKILYTYTTLRTMNAFDKHTRSFTAWCEDCDKVFDKRLIADAHAEEKKHRIKVTEFWINSR